MVTWPLNISCYLFLMNAISAQVVWHTQNDACLVHCVIHFHCHKWSAWGLIATSFVFTFDLTVKSMALKWPLFSPPPPFFFCAKCQDPTGFGNASCLCEQWAWQKCLVSVPSSSPVLHDRRLGFNNSIYNHQQLNQAAEFLHRLIIILCSAFSTIWVMGGGETG